MKPVTLIMLSLVPIILLSATVTAKQDTSHSCCYTDGVCKKDEECDGPECTCPAEEAEDLTLAILAKGRTSWALGEAVNSERGEKTYTGYPGIAKKEA